MPMPEERPVYKRGEVLWAMPEIEAMCNNAVAAERERIAVLAEKWAHAYFAHPGMMRHFLDELVAGIRSGDLDLPCL